MLYNRAWKKEHVNEAKPKICLNDFIAWLETKDPTETYNYQDRTGQCCLGQYMAARGIEWPKNWSATYRDVGKAVGGDSLAFQHVLWGGSDDRLVPFGETLERAMDYRPITRRRIKKSMENA